MEKQQQPSKKGTQKSKSLQKEFNVFMTCFFIDFSSLLYI